MGPHKKLSAGGGPACGEKRKAKMDLDILRHSCSHVLAHAVKELWPDVKLGIGPAIEDGFYYDFDKKDPFSDED
ncbi:MAG: hypothetical protein ABIH18_04075, partial [Candidatus Omnitrophota bacterium]